MNIPMMSRARAFLHRSVTSTPSAGSMLHPLTAAAETFRQKHMALKAEIDASFPWYPYDTLANFAHIAPFLAAHDLATLAGNGKILDIGAADGDTAFFLESLGYTVGIIDHAATNYNGLRGAHLVRDTLQSRVTIDDIDLDAYFSLNGTSYSLVFFLGILYHLKNPFYVLEHLAGVARHVFVSTRVARLTPGGQPIASVPAAYLLNPDESNNDATNFWIFTEAGLRRLFARSGWEILAYRSVGDTVHSDPARNDRDERAFALLRSTRIR